jgi:hypothetical protein
MSVGTAMIAAQPVTFLVMTFSRLPWMIRLGLLAQHGEIVVVGHAGSASW